MTDKDRYELKIAGLLHDCGKITTPVHVVDKATKLQTIFDRIELVEMRFEVLKRDAEIATLKQMLAHPHATTAVETSTLHSTLQATLQATQAQLSQEFAFLKHCNVGSEAMTAEAQQRVRSIAQQRSWHNRLQRQMPALTEEEIENLTIRSGTLTASERQEINHHIVTTIRMLEALPWPRHLAKVPEYAGGHHERMDGQGYPRGLKGADMSLQARMMAVADIFEALTAVDRPYKKGMTLSRSLDILANFARKGHIDPDLFEVFISSRIFEEYGKRFLHATQLDDVDTAHLLSIARA
jgi:hypothetical protein